MLFFMTVDGAGVIAGTTEAIKGWLWGNLGSLFRFHHLCYFVAARACVCEQVLHMVKYKNAPKNAKI